MDDVVELADLWVHGHMHESFDYPMGKCRVVCKPRGYAPKKECGERILRFRIHRATMKTLNSPLRISSMLGSHNGMNRRSQAPTLPVLRKTRRQVIATIGVHLLTRVI